MLGAGREALRPTRGRAWRMSPWEVCLASPVRPSFKLARESNAGSGMTNGWGKTLNRKTRERFDADGVDSTPKVLSGSRLT